ncbi:HSP20-like chaperone [Lipomyces arxii]|uniref:HSP20-like chaperone n=1 Tax=Lipomyces arxii TaxID=56418 RepID=UPI0034CF85C5
MPAFTVHPSFANIFNGEVPMLDIFDVINDQLAWKATGGGSSSSKCPAANTTCSSGTVKPAKRERVFVPAIDFFDAEKSFVIHASVPGATSNAISVDYEPKSNEVVLTGEVRRPGFFAESERALDSLRISERHIGKFERRVRLPSSAKVVPDSITARLTNGVLEVTVPKVPEQPSRKITIETVSNPADDWVDAFGEDSSSSESIEPEKLD